MFIILSWPKLQAGCNNLSHNYWKISHFLLVDAGNTKIGLSESNIALRGNRVLQEVSHRLPIATHCFKQVLIHVFAQKPIYSVLLLDVFTG